MITGVDLKHIGRKSFFDVHCKEKVGDETWPVTTEFTCGCLTAYNLGVGCNHIRAVLKRIINGDPVGSDFAQRNLIREMNRKEVLNMLVPGSFTLDGLIKVKEGYESSAHVWGKQVTCANLAKAKKLYITEAKLKPEHGGLTIDILNVDDRVAIEIAASETAESLDRKRSLLTPALTFLPVRVE